MRIFPFLFAATSLAACSEKENDTDPQDTEIQDTEDTVDTGYRIGYDPTEELESPSGCADFLFFDRNADHSSMLLLQGQGLAESAHASGETITVTYDLTELPDDIQLVFQYGTNLGHELCNDAIDPTIEVTVDDSFLPANGTLTLTVTPNGEAMGMGSFPADLDVQIQMADFCADIGDGELHHENCFNIDDYSATASIGWLPG